MTNEESRSQRIDRLANATAIKDMSDTARMVRLARVVVAFRDMPNDAYIAAYAEGDGANGVTYGDIAALVRMQVDANERIGRIAGWHSRESGPAGMVGDYCNECATRWPCNTRRMADGTYVDPEEQP